jgi:two-component system heavy metal sensor histidine kinase CusS
MTRLFGIFSLTNAASRSISGRLTIWFAATTLLLLLAKSLFTYWIMAPALTAQGEQYVSVLSRQISAQVTKGMTSDGNVDALLPANEAKFIRLRGEDGRLLGETKGMSEEFPPSEFPPPESPRVVRGLSGREYWMASNRGSDGVVAEVAFEAYEFRLLAPFGGRLWLATMVMLVLSGIAGYRIARHGIRPLQELAETVRSVGSSTLERRIDPSHLPSELQPLCSTFNEMLDRLKQAFDRVSQVTDDIAHELRTPLSIMMNQIDVVLEAERPAEEYREILESAREEIATLSDLIQRLLFLSRVENHSVVPHFEALDLKSELIAVQEFYAPLATDAGVELVMMAGLPAIRACGDRVLLQRAIGNLVVNAIRHTPAGGRVVLAAKKSAEMASISVTDTGCGIPPESLPRLFDRFFRLDRARETGSGHVGLGMAIVKAIATLHNGSVDVLSQVGKGTAVTVFLPRA